MKEQIQEVQEYFMRQILTGEFKVLEATEHYIIILIDDEYQFVFWMANGENSCNQWISSTPNFMTLREPSDEQMKEIFKALQPHYAKYMNEVTLKAKQAELEKLQEEINSITNS